MRKHEVARIVRRIKRLGFHAWAANQNSAVAVSAEHGDGAGDYYGEFRGGYAWINPKLEALATERGSYWEWENPGCFKMFD